VILALARSSHRDYHAGKLNREALALYPPSNASYKGFGQPAGRGPADAQRLADRLKRHWDEWFFLSYPEVKPDAERALRPIVVHRKVMEVPEATGVLN